MILIINSGSSTLKFRVFDDSLKERVAGIVERIKLPRSFLDYHVGAEKGHRTFAAGLNDHIEALREVFAVLTTLGFGAEEIKMVGHRVVHGGEEFVRPTVVTQAVLDRMRQYERLAPLHNPANFAGIEAAMALLPHAVQVAVFDTAFHATLPDYAYMYALPRRLYEKFGVRKYGFHGLSHHYVATEAARRLKKPLTKINLITCHLGSGSSICAIRNGQSVDTSMGLTPLQGVTMSTRCGDIDPSLPLLMMTQLGQTSDEVYDVLNHESGLKGLTGFADLRDILTMLGYEIEGFASKRRPTKEDKNQARLALDKMCYDIARYIGAYLAVLGKVEAIIFTAGVGERSPIVRQKVMSFLKLPSVAKPKVLVIPTNEELEIAREVKGLVK